MADVTAAATMVFRLESGDLVREIRLADGVAILGDAKVPIREIRMNGGGELVALEVAGDVFPVRVARDGRRVFVWCAGQTFEFRSEDPRVSRSRGATAADHGTGLLAPMPGRVRSISVPRGEKVSKGDVVLVLEAMKMEHAIRAPRDGVVTRLDHREGDLVDAGAVLAEIT
jgi:acetyl/propionyl-CoA carboxylase alpha subunit